MQRSLTSAIALAVVALSASHALAADPSVPKTRAEVLAELREAQRTGDAYADDDSGRKLNEVYPDRYPPKAAAAGKTREQVLAELREAQRTGDAYADDDSGRKLNEVYPDRYPPKAAAAGKTREQVLAELREAQRTGDAYADDDSGRKLNEVYPDRYPRRQPLSHACDAAGMGRTAIQSVQAAEPNRC